MSEPQEIREEKERHHYVVEQMADFYRPFLDVSSDGFFIYLDDEHKTCNQNLADLFGYSIEEWSGTYPFLETFVAPQHRDLVEKTYATVQDKGMSAKFEVTLLRKDGTPFTVEMAMVPVIAGDDFFTLNLARMI